MTGSPAGSPPPAGRPPETTGAAAAIDPAGLPAEPVGDRREWWAAVLDGADLGQVVTGPGGIAAWLAARWPGPAVSRLGPAGFEAVVVGYRRELWLWLEGERTWAQCCEGLAGRLRRRGADPAAGPRAGGTAVA